ncbi:hypothetical protein ACFLXF_00890 [Chloroflexota bacterium]
MPYGEYLILAVVGGVFIILGLAAIVWGKREEKSYFDALSKRSTDLREFVDHWPSRPQPGSLKLGGWLAIAIGVLTVAVGLAVVLWARMQS